MPKKKKRGNKWSSKKKSKPKAMNPIVQDAMEREQANQEILELSNEILDDIVSQHQSR